jgi:hypothetical protein
VHTGVYDDSETSQVGEQGDGVSWENSQGEGTLCAQLMGRMV